MPAQVGTDDMPILSQGLGNPVPVPAVVAPAIGFYEGIFGPGAGSFYMAAYVALLGYGAIKATAHTKMLNFASNLGSLLVFASTGATWWAVGFAMAAAQVAGAALGARLAVRVGARLIKPLVRTLVAREALGTTEHGGLMLGPAARAMMKGEAPVLMAEPPVKRTQRAARGGASATPNPVGDPLFEALRDLRREIAREAGVPPYVVFHDATLREMASARPATLSALGALPGVGAKKLETYGPRFLALLAG